ncbi:MAG: DUF4954 family protein [Spirochaetes bacterium]|nr:DUF4954 family protein [Spirochaetota bacterium]
MDEVQLLAGDQLGFGFIPDPYLPPGKNEFWIRDEQNPKPEGYWRHLTAKEIEILVKNQNTSDDWDHILVTGRFDPHRLLHNEFHGLVRIGAMEDGVLRHHDLKLPVGISRSRIISCDIGDNVAIHNVQYLCHYIIGNRCILFNVDEMNTTDHARFGNGILREGEEESTRYWIDVVNEAGGRSILPFDGMIPADAFLWAKFRDDQVLMERFFQMTQNGFDTRRGFYGTVGESSVIKNCGIIKDVKIGSHCYIKGANKLKNLTINSDAEAPTQIGEGVELVNGIIGYGCHVFYGCKAVRFVLCDHSNLKYGARLIHSVLGENSTVSCCEILNNLVFPIHEQHHNNSFLVASLVMGQSNIAAGATIGSNHNSRANDGEIVAGRGFWPGLCVSLKHPSRFASFVLIQKGSYPAELNIPFPFSLVMNNETKGQLEVMPAYFWMYNLYALKRNEWKFRTRDKRVRKRQHSEFNALAPDTVEEIFTALGLLEEWVGKAYLEQGSGKKSGEGVRSEPYRNLGRSLLKEQPELIRGLTVYGEGMENSNRPVVILKSVEAYRAYKDMILYYGVKTLLDAWERGRYSSFEEFRRSLPEAVALKRETCWFNLGGQLVPASKLEALLADIRSSRVRTWDELHARYDTLWEEYPVDKLRHAFQSLQELLEESFSSSLWRQALLEAERIQEYILQGVIQSRKKDYENPFRKASFRSEEEERAVLGRFEENPLVKMVEEETQVFKDKIRKRSIRKDPS